MTHLILETCVLSNDHSPVSDVLMNNNIVYGKISLGLVKVFDQNLDVFWGKLATTVTEANVTRFETTSKDLNVFDILLRFPKLKTVALDHQKFLKLMEGFKNVRTEADEIKYESVKSLHLSNFAAADLDLLLTHFPSVTDLYIDTSTEDSFPLEVVQDHAPILKRIILRASPREWVQMIFELKSLPSLQLEALECKIEKEQTLHLLLDYLQNQQNLSRIILHINRNLSTTIPVLKILHIDFIQDLVSFKPFQGQDELEELHLKLSRSQHRFQHQNIECFFGHQSIQLPGLKKLFLEEFNDKSCVECYEGLFQGCSGLETLSIVQTTVATGVFDLLVKYQKKLKELRIELARISETKILALCEALPTLKVLDLKATVIQGCSDSIILTLCQHLPYLTELRVTMLDITESSFDHVANHCHNLETLYLSIGGNFDLERIFRPFECIPRLKRICNILSSHDLTRIDYYEVYVRKNKSLDTYLGRRNWTQIDYYVMTWDVEEGNNVNASDSFTIRPEVGFGPEF